MYRIVLVDDEQQIRKGLRNLIIWDELGIEIVGEAADGESALDLIQSLNPQLVIADIQMPHMDGLSLLKQARALTNPPKFIMLSGFSQFDYVRTSMRLGASNYLLKPVNSEELKMTLTETVEQLEDEASHKQQFEQSMEILLNNTLNRLLASRIEVRELREKCQLLGITLRCNNLSVGVLRPQFNNEDPALRYIIFESLKICQKILNPHLTAYCVVDATDNIAIIFKNPNGSFDHAALYELLNTCSHQIEEKLGIPCQVALGNQAASFRDLPGSYQCALHLLDIKGIWTEADLPLNTVVAMQQVVSSSFDSERLQTLMSLNQSGEILNMVRTFFDVTLPENQIFDSTTIKYHTIELVTCILQAAQKCYVPQSKLLRLKAASYAAIRNTSSLSSLQNQICNLLEQVCNWMEHVDTSNYSQNVQFAVRYIHLHYSDINLCLKTLANTLKINSAYLGRQFNLETGTFFSDYLNNVRIQNARVLLNTTSMKVSEIAEKIGFSNVSYFNTIYKKIAGECPGNTRNQD